MSDVAMSSNAPISKRSESLLNDKVSGLWIHRLSEVDFERLAWPRCRQFSKSFHVSVRDNLLSK
jgi:hypothetical protein